jgi:peptide/nickel transport system substrate-binding protein
MKIFLIFVFLLIASALLKLKAADAPFVKAIYSVPKTLDPIRMNDTASLMVSNLIYEGLLKLSPSLRFTGSLATSWSVDKSGKIYIFKLRPNALFHDGSPVTPYDVLESLKRAQSPTSLVSKYYDCIDDIKVTGHDQVTIILKYPFPPFLSILAGATAKILPKNKMNSLNFFSHPIGSGPFRYIEFKEINDNESILKLSHFDKSNSLTNIKTLILRSLPEAEALIEAKKGKIHDLTTFPLSGNEDILKQGHDLPTLVSATWIIGLNSKLVPFNNIKIRQAFKASVDVESFRLKFHADSKKATNYIPVGFPGHLAEKDLPLPNKEILIPKHPPIKIAFPSVLAKEKEMREHLQSNLRKKGWDVTFVPMEWDKLMEGYNQKSLQGFVLSMNMDYPDTEFLIRNFESNNPDNFSGLKDKLIDSLIQKARHTEDRLERAEIYTQLAKKIEELAVTVNLFYPRIHYWINDCVKNLKPNILAEYYIDYSEVKIDQACLNKLEKGK